MFLSIVEKRSVITNPTNAQLEKQLVCYLLSQSNCSSLEHQRFSAMITWIYRFPALKFTGPSLRFYLDKQVNNSRTYKPSLMFNLTDLNIYQYNFNNYQANLTKIVALNSSQLRIDCEIVAGSRHQAALSWVNFTFILPKGSNPPMLTYNYNTASTSLKNG